MIRGKRRGIVIELAHREKVFPFYETLSRDFEKSSAIAQANLCSQDRVHNSQLETVTASFRARNFSDSRELVDFFINLRNFRNLEKFVGLLKY